jgi:hypothetical protein
MQAIRNLLMALDPGNHPGISSNAHRIPSPVTANRIPRYYVDQPDITKRCHPTCAFYNGCIIVPDVPSRRLFSSFWPPAV